jgi:hypothetical protein
MAEHTPNRFRISWDGDAYYISIPNYHGGEVVPASIADDLVKALEECCNLAGAYVDERDAIDWLKTIQRVTRDALADVKAVHGTAAGCVFPSTTRQAEDPK